MPFVDQDALALRATHAPGLARLQQVRVTLDTTVSPAKALLDVKFWTPDPVLAIAMDPRPPSEVFPILGGHRVPAGTAPGMVQVVSIEVTPASDTLRLVVSPVGDYSTYTLSLVSSPQDPLFASIDFKFRPGCFSVDCAPEWTRPPEPIAAPAFDTLARDYDSFRHALITAMQQRVPGWQATSDADLSVTLLDLFAAAADELADYQDRVMNEAYLATARNRVSLARHARLVDYQVHQGNQASTILALRVAASVDEFPPGLAVRTNDPDATAGTTFVTTETVPLLNVLDNLSLYTWDNTRRELAKGDTSADLRFFDLGQANAAIERWTKRPLPRLLIAEEKNPRTGGIAGRNPDKRQILHITNAELVGDPLNPTEAIVRVTWRADDALAFDYCFVEKLADGSLVTDICRFHGNLVVATAGTPVERTFVVGESTRWGTLCPLPPDLPLLYQNTPADGVTAPLSTLEVTVADGSGNPVPFTETISLVHSSSQDRDFAVETDQLRRSAIRFGNGTNGFKLEPGVKVTARWRTGLPLDGNIGRDRLTKTDDLTITSVWNPFDATDGRDPERAEEVRRNAPEAFRQHQLRAVTLADYVARAEEVPGVSRAAATYLWTGSWRTVRVTIDPTGTEELSAELAADVARHLEVLRLIGEDLEIRAPIFVPLRIELVVCLRDDVWPEEIRFAIDKELSDGWTDDGRRALFHPDNWTFGQPLYESEIAGRLQRIDGVEHIAKLSVYRWDAASPGDGNHVEVGPSEIIRVHNDPDHMERGFIDIQLVGGRR